MAETDLKILVIGDSNSFGWPEKLEEYCPGVSVKHIGEKSRTIPWVRGQLEKVGPGKYEDLIVYVGVNDIHNGRKLSDMEREIREIQEIALKRGFKKVIFAEVPPWEGYSRWIPESGERTGKFNEMLGKVAAEPGSIAQVAKTSGILLEKVPPELRGRLFGADGLHLSRDGQEVVARIIAESAYGSLIWKAIRGGEYELLSQRIDGWLRQKESAAPAKKQERVAMR